MAIADAATTQPAARAYRICGYVFVNNTPMDDVLVYTSYGGGSNALTGADSVGRHGYYTLSATTSDGPATVVALYAQSNSVGNYSATAKIDHPNTVDGYDTQNLYIYTNETPETPALTARRGLIDSVAQVVDNFISRLADWAANIGSPVPSGNNGGVNARAVTFDAAEIPHAYLALVNASNLSEELYSAQADDHGVYYFSGVKSVYNATSDAYDRAYCLKAKAYGNTSEGVSTPFSVIPGQMVNVTAIIFPKPANITLQGPDLIKANGHVTYMAYVTDALGHPVADGNMIRFTLLSEDKGMGKLGAKGSETPAGLAIVVPTTGGYAEVEYGWASGTGVNTVNAAYRDDPKVKASMAVMLN